MASVYSFHKAGGHAFVMSPGKARNRFTAPIGTGWNACFANCAGFAGVNPDNLNLWDWSKWYPKGLFRFEYLINGVIKIHQFTITSTKYFIDEGQNPAWLLNVEIDEFRNPILDGEELVRNYIVTSDSATTEWRTVAPSAEGPAGTLKYSEKYTWLGYQDEPFRTWDRLVNGVQAVVDSSNTFTRNYYLDNNGFRLSSANYGPMRVFSRANLKVSSLYLNGIPESVPLQSSIAHAPAGPGFDPFWYSTATMKKYRFKMTTPTESIYTRQKDYTLSSTTGQIELLSRAPLPNGIDVAIPQRIQDRFFDDYQSGVTNLGNNAFDVIWRRTITPPETKPPGIP